MVNRKYAAIINLSPPNARQGAASAIHISLAVSTCNFAYEMVLLKAKRVALYHVVTGKSSCLTMAVTHAPIKLQDTEIMLLMPPNDPNN